MKLGGAARKLQQERPSSFEKLRQEPRKIIAKLRVKLRQGRRSSFEDLREELHRMTAELQVKLRSIYVKLRRQPGQELPRISQEPGEERVRSGPEPRREPPAR